MTEVAAHYTYELSLRDDGFAVVAVKWDQENDNGVVLGTDHSRWLVPNTLFEDEGDYL